MVIANPPYSAGRTSENDNNQNLEYPHSTSASAQPTRRDRRQRFKNSLYDSYIRAIRWASDRIKDKGVVGFVTNGSFIDGNAMDGLARVSDRRVHSPSTSSTCAGTSGRAAKCRDRKAERSSAPAAAHPIAITLLVKNPAKKAPATLRYHDIGDYLSREEKLTIISGFGSIAGIEAGEEVDDAQPNDEHDWINQRDPAFEQFIAIGDKGRSRR